MTSLGGLGFVIGIILLGTGLGTIELSTMLAYGSMGGSVVAPALFLVFAGLTKAAQMPFDSWLLGAMVAPTPTSALLHSSTMVKAGVFLIIKLAPVLGWNIAGIMAMFRRRHNIPHDLVRCYRTDKRQESSCLLDNIQPRTDLRLRRRRNT